MEIFGLIKMTWKFIEGNIWSLVSNYNGITKEGKKVVADELSHLVDFIIEYGAQLSVVEENKDERDI